MKFEDVIDMMLILMDDYNIVNTSEEDFILEVGIRTNVVIARTDFEDLTFDLETHSFNRDLNLTEATIIAYGLLMVWLSPKANNSEVLSTQLSSKEVTEFSNANRINSTISLYKLAKTEFYQLMSKYDSMKAKEEIKKFLEESEK